MAESIYSISLVWKCALPFDVICGTDLTKIMLQEDRGGSRRPESSRKPAANTKPSKTLFVINFDPVHTRTRDIERYFEPYGRISNVRIRRNFAFVQYESEDDASRALEATNMRLAV